MIIKKITAQETFIVRHPVLRPGKPISECLFNEDNNPSSIHLGLEINGHIISVISALPIQCENFPFIMSMRLRGIATLKEHQRKGFGSRLIIDIEKRVFNLKKIGLIWLNARISANIFYENLGYKAIGKTFDIQGIGIHQRYNKKK